MQQEIVTYPTKQAFIQNRLTPRTGQFINIHTLAHQLVQDRGTGKTVLWSVQEVYWVRPDPSRGIRAGATRRKIFCDVFTRGTKGCWQVQSHEASPELEFSSCPPEFLEQVPLSKEMDAWKNRVGDYHGLFAAKAA